jgi:hypothetical protein
MRLSRVCLGIKFTLMMMKSKRKKTSHVKCEQSKELRSRNLRHKEKRFLGRELLFSIRTVGRDKTLDGKVSSLKDNIIIKALLILSVFSKS